MKWRKGRPREGKPRAKQSISERMFRARRALYPLMVPLPSGRVEKVMEYAMAHAPRHPYHNKSHTALVLYTVREIAKKEGIARDSTQMQRMETAALLHDIVFEKGAKDNEARSAELAGKILPGLGYDERDVRIVQRMILSTALPQTPRTLFEQILCDADLGNLGSRNFFRESALVAQENGLHPESKEALQHTWSLFKNHRFHTEGAKELYGKKWAENREQLRKRLEGAK